MTKIRSGVVGISVLLLVLLAVAPALADGEGPPQPLSGHATHLLVTGIVAAVIAVAAWLALFRIAMARRRRSVITPRPQGTQKDQT